MKQESMREISTLKQTIAELERKLAMANRGRRKLWPHAPLTAASITKRLQTIVDYLQAATPNVLYIYDIVMYTITNWCTLRQYEAYYCKAVRSPNCQCLTYVPTITSCCCVMLCNTHGHIFIVRGAMVARRMQLQGCLVKRAVSWIGLETDFKMWVLFRIVFSSIRFWRTTFLWPIYIQWNNISSYTSGQNGSVLA